MIGAAELRGSKLGTCRAFSSLALSAASPGNRPRVTPRECWGKTLCSLWHHVTKRSKEPGERQKTAGDPKRTTTTTTTKNNNNNHNHHNRQQLQQPQPHEQQQQQQLQQT